MASPLEDLRPGANPPQAKLRTSAKRLSEIGSVIRKYKLNEGVTPVKLRCALEELGPTFVKLGQIMSLRSDMLPREFCDELAKLRMEVDPLPWDQIKPHLEAEFSQPLSSLFSEIDPTPLGSASIAQVYRARLMDGEEVVIKVQRPGIRELMTRDISLMRRAVDTVDFVNPQVSAKIIDLPALVDELWQAFQREIDFLQEAASIEEFASNNAQIVYTGTPRVHMELCTQQVLVMEFIEGITLDDTDALVKAGYDTAEIGAKLAESFTKQVLDDGFFHADPHPANLIVREGEIVWIDLGMMGRFSTHERLLLRAIITDMVAGDAAAVKEGLLSVAQANGDVDHARMLADIESMLERYGFTTIEELDMGSALADLFELVRRHSIKLPTSFVMLGRGYVTLEATIAMCKTELTTMQIMQAHLADAMVDLDFKDDLMKMVVGSRRSMRKMADLPARVSDLVDMAAKGQIKTNMDLKGSEEPIKLLGIIVDRLGIALVASALFMGSSVLCLTDLAPKILGIPLLGLAGYVGALVLSLWFIYQVWRRKG